MQQGISRNSISPGTFPLPARPIFGCSGRLSTGKPRLLPRLSSQARGIKTHDRLRPGYPEVRNVPRWITQGTKERNAGRYPPAPGIYVPCGYK